MAKDKPTTAKKPEFSFDRRSAGVLMHMTSLPGPHGSGDLGPAAHDFVDVLSDAGMRWWQMLPINPPDGAPAFSPYSCPSTFAGSPWLVSLEQLVNEGMLSRADVRVPRGLFADDARVDFPKSIAFREAALRKAFANVGTTLPKAYHAFAVREAKWLDDWATFAALRQQNDGAKWTKWKHRDAGKLPVSEITFHKFVQWLFAAQWKKLRDHARAKGVGLIGDVPIFVGHDSADVWANPSLFLLQKNGQPQVVTGCPPDFFNKLGQIWRHPHYDWREHQKQKFAWWVERFRATFELFDAVRIDHFLGFYRLWAIPAQRNDGRVGKWIFTPGRELFTELTKRIGKLPIIAEDLGTVTEEAMQLRDDFGFPGMRVLQFGFTKDEGDDFHRPHNWPRQCVAYTGTHDNDTTNGHLLDTARRAELARAVDYAGVDPKNPSAGLVRLAMSSIADTVVIPTQDIVGLGSEARMNLPGTEGGANWAWRLKTGQLTEKHVAWLKRLAVLSGRA
jgi:4-alpha-glucanotransferase